MPDRNKDSQDKRESHNRVGSLLDEFDQGLKKLGIHDASEKLEGERSVHELRKGRDRRDSDPVSVLTLSEVDGVLNWNSGSGFRPPGRDGKRRGPRRTRMIQGDIIRQVKFQNLEPNQVGAALDKLDQTLNDHQGFWLLAKNAAKGNWELGKRIDAPVVKGKVLLIVHGTFSNTKNNLAAINETKAGIAFLEDAEKRYDQIIAFSHATTAVSPFTNAVELGTFFRKSDVSVDVICHSRGGLVVRWWNEVVESHASRSVRIAFLGATLGGTSLAAPHQLKNSLNLLTNISRAVTVGSQVGAVVFPAAGALMAASLGISRIFTSVTSVLGNTPVIDSGMALVPGLNGQSRQGANAEIKVLRDSFGQMTSAQKTALLRSYYFVSANFEPKSDHPWWHFWRFFNKSRVINAVADRIFPGDNDLVVDTDSMSELCDLDLKLLTKTQLNLVRKQTHRYSPSNGIHHLNYFSKSTTFNCFSKHFGS